MAICVTSSQDVEVFTVFKLGVFFTEDPGEHLPGLHAGSDNSPALVPMTPRLLVGVRPLHPDLVEDSHEEFVYVVVDAYGDLDELGSVGARKAFAV